MRNLKHKELREIGDLLKEIKQITMGEVDTPGVKKSVERMDRIVKKTKDLIDEGFYKSIKPEISIVHFFWMALVMTILLFFIGVSIGIGYMAIADLEDAVYHGIKIERSQ